MKPSMHDVMGKGTKDVMSDAPKHDDRGMHVETLKRVLKLKDADASALADAIKALSDGSMMSSSEDSEPMPSSKPGSLMAILGKAKR